MENNGYIKKIQKFHNRSLNTIANLLYLISSIIISISQKTYHSTPTKMTIISI